MSKLDCLECTGEVNTMTGIDAMSGTVASVTVSVVGVAVGVAELTLTGSSFLSGCRVLPPPPISSSMSPTLLKSESTSNSNSDDDLGS